MTDGLALLFDLDGTLVHSDPLHFAVFRELFAEYGVPLSRKAFQARISGSTNAAIFSHFLPDLDAEAEALAERKEAAFRARLGQSLAPIAGTVALLDLAAAHRIPTAVVTNAPRANAVAMLGAAGLAPRFPVVHAAEDFPRGKPDPFPYRLAMETLGARPERSIAFEDSRSGLASARDAGAFVFGLASSLAPAALLQAGAHQAIADFTDSALWAFLDQRLAELT